MGALSGRLKRPDPAHSVIDEDALLEAAQTLYQKGVNDIRDDGSLPMEMARGSVRCTTTTMRSHRSCRWRKCPAYGRQSDADGPRGHASASLSEPG